MALIKCPECGKEISDKATSCVFCGRELKKLDESGTSLKICAECGAELSEIDKVCPKCGYPISQNDDTQKVEITSVKIKKSTKRTICGVIGLILFCIICVFGYKTYTEQEKNKQYIESYNEYIGNVEMIRILMLAGGSDAESLCNLTLKVWGNSIYKEKDDETDKYTRPEGFFVKDFNEAIMNLYSDETTIDTISNIEKNQASVRDLMKELQNPPDELNQCYETISELYVSYNALMDLAISPSGNYSSFNESKNTVISDFMASYQKLDTQIPEMKIQN